METYMIWIWLAVVLISLTYEFFSPSLTSIWFAIGGLVSLVLAAFKVNILVQVIVFIIVSLIFLISLRKIALKWLYSKKQEKTNTDALIGGSYTLKGDINENQNGTIKINGVEWSCVAKDNQAQIKDGTKVTIIEIKGNKLVVEEKGEEN